MSDSKTKKKGSKDGIYKFDISSVKSKIDNKRNKLEAGKETIKKSVE